MITNIVTSVCDKNNNSGVLLSFSLQDANNDDNGGNHDHAETNKNKVSYVVTQLQH